MQFRHTRIGSNAILGALALSAFIFLFGQPSRCGASAAVSSGQIFERSETWQVAPFWRVVIESPINEFPTRSGAGEGEIGQKMLAEDPLLPRHPELFLT